MTETIKTTYKDIHITAEGRTPSDALGRINKIKARIDRGHYDSIGKKLAITAKR